MNAHVAELLAVIGPGLCYALGALALFWLRSLFRNFDDVLRRNSDAHEEMLARLNDHESRLARQSARLDGNDRDLHERASRDNAMQQAMLNLAERVSRVEAHIRPGQ